MAQADGSIRIEAIVSDEKAKKKLDQLNAKLRRQTESVDKQATAVDRLKEKYAELTAENAEPKGAKKLADELKKPKQKRKNSIRNTRSSANMRTSAKRPTAQ